jgi:predicted transcriptional regulator
MDYLNENGYVELKPATPEYRAHYIVTEKGVSWAMN